jgi:putative copper resistance protein D
VNSLVDVAGFVDVVVAGLGYAAQSVLVGSAAFVLFVLPALDGDALRARTHAVARVAARATLAAALVSIVSTALVLATTLDLPVDEIADAPFVLVGVAKALAAIGVAAALPRARSPAMRAACLLACIALLAAAAADSHAVARLEHAPRLMIATALHALGAGLWLGGLPCLWLALRSAEPHVARTIGRRYSALAAAGAACIVAGALVFSVDYLGSVDALYATAYGAMAGVKIVLLTLLLPLGYANFRALRATAADGVVVPRVRRFVELEIGIAFAAVMAAASIASSPVARDVVQDRLTLPELAARVAPALPRLTTPVAGALANPAHGAHPRDDADRAWSEYNHHVAGLAVALVGIGALARRSGVRVARHWPLLILPLAAFVAVRADPEVWPLGPLGIVESLRDPEVAQHRIFVVLIAALALIEWRAQRRPAGATSRARLFPLTVLLGAALLLTHSHAVGDAKEQLLVEMTHLPIALLGVVAACARWLELGAPAGEGRIAGFVWPSAFLLVGLLLLDYREA